MLLQCPSCHTTYKVSDGLIPKSNPTFRCSRCKHIFVLGSKPEAEPTEEAPPLPSHTLKEDEGTDQDLSFSFSPADEKKVREEKEMGEEEEAISIPRATEEELSPPGDDSFTIPAEELSTQSTLTHRDAEFDNELWTSPPPEEEKATSTPLDSPKGVSLSILPFVGLLGVFLLVYSLLAFLGQAQPRRLEGWLKRIPWFGSSVFKNSYLRQRISLSSLHPNFQRILENREVFAISGVVVNRNPVSVREIRIEGRIFNAEGKEIERQSISVGNAISLKALSGLTAQDIPVLQKTRSWKTFQIAPGGSASFVIVFLKPIGEVKQFGWRVLSAEEGS